MKQTVAYVMLAAFVGLWLGYRVGYQQAMYEGSKALQTVNAKLTETEKLVKEKWRAHLEQDEQRDQDLAKQLQDLGLQLHTVRVEMEKKAWPPMEDAAPASESAKVSGQTQK